MRLWLRLWFLAAAFPLGLAAHIGSPAAVLEGKAGPYAIRVIALPAPVVPGRAEINVRLLDADPGSVTVTALPVNWRVGLKGAPPPDVAEPVAGEPRLYHGELWIMTAGSYSVHVSVSGARGQGTLIVPFEAVASQTLPMSRGLGAILAVFGAILVIGAVGIVGVGARESVLLPGLEPAVRDRRRAMIVAAMAAAVIVTLLWGGKRWWDREDANYRNNEVYAADPLDASIVQGRGGATLHLEIGDTDREDPGPLKLIPDHGKLMHLFLIREPGLDAMAHVHPLPAGARAFAVAMPPLPGGRYRLYADITYETGFAATLTTTVDWRPGGPEVATAKAPPRRDPDDSWFVGLPGGPSAGARIVRSSAGTLRAGQDLTLAFGLQGADGRPAAGEAYMGMLGHAAVRRSDGSVFAHIHPVGTVSMASEDFFQRQAARQTGQPAPVDHSRHHPASGFTAVSFPYLFPKAGEYRVWVQAKIAGQVVTGVFDYQVTE